MKGSVFLLKIQSIKREIFPKTFKGIEYNSKSIVLVRLKDIRLLWRKGSQTCVISYFKPSYYAPTELVILDTSDVNYPRETILHTGGRLSKALLHQYKNEIDNSFGKGITDLINTKKTLVIQE